MRKIVIAPLVFLASCSFFPEIEHLGEKVALDMIEVAGNDFVLTYDQAKAEKVKDARPAAPWIIAFVAAGVCCFLLINSLNSSIIKKM